MSVLVNNSLHDSGEDEQTRDRANREEIDNLLARLPQLEQHFELHRKIGEGTFSSVYLGSLKAHRDLPLHRRRLFAIKHLVPTSHPSRIEQELKCLREIGGKDNVINVELCLRNLDTVVFVMPYIPHRRFSEYVNLMDVEEIRRYMSALLVALRRVHSMGVIHRDIKPGNFLYDRVGQRYQLVDFGLAQRVITALPPGRKRLRDENGDEGPPAKKSTLMSLPPTSITTELALQVSAVHQRRCRCSGGARVCQRCSRLCSCRAARAGTAGYRAPEVLLRVQQQGPALDLWAAGVLLLAAAIPRSPLAATPRSDLAALAQLTALLGERAMSNAARALGRRLVLSRTPRGICLRRLCRYAREGQLSHEQSQRRCENCALSEENCLCLELDQDPAEIRAGARWAGLPDELFSLLYHLLEPDPSRRITADQALRHPFITATYPSQFYSS